MEKRIFIAILTSIAVLWLWAAVAPKLFPELAKKPEPAATASAPSTNGAPASKTAPSTAVPANRATTPAAPALVAQNPVSAAAEQETEVDTPDFTARFTNRGAQLVSFRLKKYQAKDKRAVELVKSRPAGQQDYPFAIESSNEPLAARANSALYAVNDSTQGGKRVIEFSYVGADGVAITKTFEFTNEYQFGFAVRVSPTVPYRVVIGPGIRNLGPEERDSQIVVTGNGAVMNDGKLEVVRREKGDRLRVYKAAQYIGIEDNYFLTALRPDHGGDAVLRRVELPSNETGKKAEKRKDFFAAVNAAGDGVVSGKAFFGPKETKIVDAYGYEATLQFGWFGIIARFLLRMLVWINQFTKNYGFAIIVLTMLIKIVLYPLQHKSIVSMKKMQKVQPKVEAIKNRYKKARTDPDQRQKMNVEMMQLYQKEGINPMSGCLPIVLQLPILWGFYGLLSRAIELRGAPFILWIHDLADKDPYYITPLLMTATMFLQTYLTPSTGDPSQRRIFLIMPLVFGFLFKDFPSGLVLYWLVQNILTIIQQLIMNKWWKDHPEEIQNA